MDKCTIFKIEGNVSLTLIPRKITKYIKLKMYVYFFLRRCYIHMFIVENLENI